MIKPFTKNKRHPSQQSHTLNHSIKIPNNPKTAFNLPTIGLIYSFYLKFYKCLTHFVFRDTESNLT